MIESSDLRMTEARFGPITQDCSMEGPVIARKDDHKDDYSDELLWQASSLFHFLYLKLTD